MEFKFKHGTKQKQMTFKRQNENCQWKIMFDVINPVVTQVVMNM